MRGVLVSILIATAVASSAWAQDGQDEVIRLEATGVVDPFLASYLVDEIEAAQGSAAILIEIDTPGGLDSAMRDIVQAILRSQTPVLCYVPPGARAASAGAFILMACPYAAMAPGTNVGAAAPVGVSGAILREKVVNDAAAYLRSLAERHDRNTEWAERAVRDAISTSAEEALDIGVIDLIATDTSELLEAVDGSTVPTAAGDVTVDVDDAEVVTRSMGLGSGLLHSLFTPDLAFIFFFLGLILLVFEFLHPGLSIPGILGVFFLGAAIASFGMLPVELVGILLLIVSIGAFILEAKHPGIGAAGAIALITLVVGGLLLFDRAVPGAGVSPITIVPVAVVMALFFALVIPRALAARRLPKRDSLARIVGMEGVAVTAIAPNGVARVGAENWSVEAIDGDIEEGAGIRVVGSEGLRLKVERAIGEAPTPVAHSADKEA